MRSRDSWYSLESLGSPNRQNPCHTNYSALQVNLIWMQEPFPPQPHLVHTTLKPPAEVRGCPDSHHPHMPWARASSFVKTLSSAGCATSGFLSNHTGGWHPAATQTWPLGLASPSRVSFWHLNDSNVCRLRVGWRWESNALLRKAKRFHDRFKESSVIRHGQRRVHL